MDTFSGVIGDGDASSLTALEQQGLSAEQLRTIYREMVRARALDEQCVALQRQGFFSAVAPFVGHEAVQVGSVLALDRERDFVFPTYRELAAACAWGVDPVEYLNQARGFSHGGGYDQAQLRFGPVAAIVAGPLLQAVGWALGRALDQAGAVALVFFGEGASSQGDVHEALNFAALFAAPVVFLCVNNQWAISVPSSRQVAGGSIAARAAGYGLQGLQVDGSDAIAVWSAVRAAAAAARAGHGPALIEALTYRYGPHSTSDDPSRYRETMDAAAWATADPVRRFGRFVKRTALIDASTLADVDASAQAWAADVAAKVRALTPPAAEEIFRFTYRNQTEALATQQRERMAQISDE